jgi:hypothetical protein
MHEIAGRIAQALQGASDPQSDGTECESDAESLSDNGSDEGVSDVEVPAAAIVADLSQIVLDTMFSSDARPTAYSENGTSSERIKRIIKEGCSECKLRCVSAFTSKSLGTTCKSFWRLNKEAQDVVLWSLGAGVKRHILLRKPGPLAGKQTDVPGLETIPGPARGFTHRPQSPTVLRCPTIPFPRALAGGACVISLSPGRTSPGKRRSWKLDGNSACRKGLCKALGIGRARLSRVIRTFRGKDGRGYSELPRLSACRLGFRPDLMLHTAPFDLH